MLNIFFPIRLNNNFIFKKRILIIYITQNNFSAVLIYAKGNKRDIIKNIFFEFDNKENSTNELFLSSLISKSISNWTYDYIKLILSSNMVIFRSLYSPFSDIEKTKMTIPFELESLLPFQLIEASVDVIYQNKKRSLTKNKVLAVITKEESLNIYREIFKKLNLTLYSITIDAIELIQYDLYYYKNGTSSHLVLYNNNSGILILLFSENELITIKYIDVLINDTEPDKQIDEKNENIELGETNFYLIKQILNSISKDFNFSLSGININMIGLNINDTLIKKLIEEYQFKIDDYIVDNNNKYINNNVIMNKNSDENIIIKNSFIYIAASLFSENDIFNLGHKENTDFKNKILFKQTIVSIIFSFLLYIIIFIYNFLDLYQINNEIFQAEYQLIDLLKKEFKLNNKYTYSLDASLNESKKMLEEIENNLPVLVTHNKFLFINLFSSIVKNLSNEIKGLQIHEIRWKLGVDNPSIINLIGEVNDFDSLHIFEENLKKTNLFLLVPQQQDLHFNFNLTIAT
jgi:hypothetical protein